MTKSTKTLQSGTLPPVPSRQWDPVHQRRFFEPFGSVKWRWMMLVAYLERGDQRQRELAARLSACRKGTPCGSPGCPVCLWRYHRWLAGAAFQGLTENGTDRNPAALSVSLTPHSLRFRFGDERTFDMRQAADELRTLLTRRGFTGLPVLGCLNFDAHPWNKRLQSGVWAGRWELLIACDDTDNIRDALKRYYPSCPYDGDQVWVRPVRLNLQRTVDICRSELLWLLGSASDGVSRLHVHSDLHNDLLSRIAVLLDQWNFCDRLVLNWFRLEGWRLTREAPSPGYRPRIIRD